MTNNFSSRQGFTLLEILLVVAALGILAGIVILAINPGKQLGDTRNAARKVDVNTIINAVYQYSLDNNGNLPPGLGVASCLTVATSEICRSTLPTSSCSSYVNLTDTITAGEKYLVSIPVDPSQTANATGTGYRITKTTNGRLQVCAPLAEQGAVIDIKR